MPTDLDRALAGARAVRFLCSGNVVRSAFAELYARHRGCPLPADSAATTFQNAAIFDETRVALAARGVPEAWMADFRPRHLSRLERPEGELLLLAMTPEHVAAWRRFFPGHERVALLGELLGGPTAIADPVMDGADFDATFERVARAVDELIARLGGAGAG